MTGVRAGAVAAALVCSACVYYNGIYNAEQAWSQAERYRLQGSDSLAALRYEDVIRKASRAFRRDPDGPWSADALLLVGQAMLRRGEVARARGVLARALAQEPRAEVRVRILIQQAAALLASGEREAALARLNDALGSGAAADVLAEGHYWRGILLLRSGRGDAGWWDLARAAAGPPPVAAGAALAELEWAVRLGAPDRAEDAMRRLLSVEAASARRDSVAALLDAAAARWGALRAAALVPPGAASAWPAGARDMLALARARLLAAAGRMDEARAAASAVADGVGGAAASARVLLARWALAGALDVAQLLNVRRVLLPAAADPEAAGLLDAVARVLSLAERGLDEPLAWFAAGELARERLGAPRLARGFYLAYADQAPDQPWVPKALLAALAVSSTEGDRAWIRGRLEGRRDSPYVRAARGASAPGFEDLEEELARRLAEMRSR